MYTCTYMQVRNCAFIISMLTHTRHALYLSARRVFYIYSIDFKSRSAKRELRSHCSPPYLIIKGLVQLNARLYGKRRLSVFYQSSIIDPFVLRCFSLLKNIRFSFTPFITILKPCLRKHFASSKPSPRVFPVITIVFIRCLC